MNRVPIAVVGGIAGLIVYIMIATAVADIVVPMHWTIQAAYYLVAGVAWVFPIHWLMFWSVHKR